MRPVKILLVDDHPMVIEGLKAIFQRIEGIEVTGSAANADEAMLFLRDNPMIRVALVDINLPRVSGIELCEHIRREFHDVIVLAMSSYRDRDYISQMIQAGASGYLVKSAGIDEIRKAVHAALDGKLYISVEADAEMKVGAKPARNCPVLTQREKQVLSLIADGYTNHQIAEKLFISPHTIDSHRKNLLNKFEVRNTAALINSAIRHKLLDG